MHLLHLHLPTTQLTSSTCISPTLQKPHASPATDCLRLRLRLLPRILERPTTKTVTARLRLQPPTKLHLSGTPESLHLLHSSPSSRQPHRCRTEQHCTALYCIRILSTSPHFAIPQFIINCVTKLGISRPSQTATFTVSLVRLTLWDYSSTQRLFGHNPAPQSCRPPFQAHPDR